MNKKINKIDKPIEQIDTISYLNSINISDEDRKLCLEDYVLYGCFTLVPKDGESYKRVDPTKVIIK